MCTGIVTLSPPLLPAQDTVNPQKGSVSFAVPESPAFTFLGASPAKVSQPGTARDLAVQLVNAFDDEGRVRQGIALEIRPAYLRPIPLEKYREYWSRLLYNAQVSVGTVKVAGNSGATDLAMGLRLTLVDRSDRMLDEGYVDTLREVINACKPANPGEPKAKALACMAEASKQAREKWLDQHWNGFRVSVAFATGWRAPGSVLKDSTSNGWSAWVGGSVPLLSRGQLVGQVQYVSHPEDALPTDAAPRELKFGCRSFLGNGRINAFLEVTGTKRYQVPAGTDKQSYTWSGGLEFRVADQAWIAAGFGNSFGATGSTARLSVLANVRFAVSDESRIKAAVN
jgi:hypothetical protein